MVSRLCPTPMNFTNLNETFFYSEPHCEGFVGLALEEFVRIQVIIDPRVFHAGTCAGQHGMHYLKLQGREQLGLTT